MRQFQWSRHKLVLFDEAHPEMVAKQRLLFQAGTQIVQLGTSATNCHSYSVFVHRVRMVLASNYWSRELKTLSEDDRAWLAGNAHVVSIHEECFTS